MAAKEPDEREFFAEAPAAGIARPTPAADAPHYLGHRQRMRERAARQGHDTLADYELLELVLYRSVPRGDTKPLAKALLARFGSFAEVLGAPEHLLREMKGVGEAVAGDLKTIAAAARRMSKSEVAGRTMLGSWTQVIDYCRTAMAFETREQFRILFLDKKNQLIGDEVQQTGTVDHTPVYPREVLRRAIELSATALILVHNYPTRYPTGIVGHVQSRTNYDLTKFQ